MNLPTSETGIQLLVWVYLVLFYTSTKRIKTVKEERNGDLFYYRVYVSGLK